jgi:alkyl hydroperoxide reductase 1
VRQLDWVGAEANQEIEQFPEGIKFSYIPYREENASTVACGIPVFYDCDKELANKKVVIVSVPGSFTPVCTGNHIPPYIERISELKAKGVDDVIVIAHNDAYVQAAWGKALGDRGNIIFACDKDCAFSALGDFLEHSKAMGTRTARYALIVDNGKITYAEKEPDLDVTVSGVDAILNNL